MENRLKIVYGIYKVADSPCRAIYDCILSIKSILLYNSNVDFVVYVSDKSIEDIIRTYIKYERLNFIIDTSFVDSIYKCCADKGSHKYLTKGIFYRIQALTEQRNFLYLDTDVICTGPLTKMPKYKKTKDIIKNINDSSCIMYSFKGIDVKDLLYYIVYHKDHIKELEFPDECIIHDAFGFMERLYKFENLYHFGNTECLVKTLCFKVKFENVLSYLNSLKKGDEMNLGLFESYFRMVRPEFIEQNLGKN